MYEYGAQLLSVVDGDTMHVRVDLGMDIYSNTTLRVLGINAPEMKTPEGKDARVWAMTWFANHCPAGDLTIATVKDHKEKYGRYLATITAPDGRVFNDDIIAAGHAVPYNP